MEQSLNSPRRSTNASYLAARLHEHRRCASSRRRVRHSGAGSICFARLDAEEGALAFCRRLVEEAGVVLLPSTVFDYGDAHVRFGLGRAAFGEGLQALAAWLERRGV